MPAIRDIKAEIPMTKSQKFKSVRLVRQAKRPAKIYGGTCSRCGATSATCRPGTYHVQCGEDRTEIEQLMKTSKGRELLNTYLGIDGQGKWLSSDDCDHFLKEAAYLIQDSIEVDSDGPEVQFLRKTPVGRILGKFWFREGFTLHREDYGVFLSEVRALAAKRNFDSQKGWGTLGEHYGYIWEQVPNSEPAQMPIAA